MKLKLEDMVGRWYILQSNFPMWTKGDKLNPTFNYELAEKNGEKGLYDQVQYVQSGRVKSIRGYDSAMNVENTKYTWRGKGILSLLTSRWEILHLDEQKKWAIIYFEKTLFTPEGYDVISKHKKLSELQEKEVKKSLELLEIVVELTQINQT